MKIVFLCGHQSPYGIAHLEPLLKSDLEIVAIVLATNKRWNIFREKLSGKDFYSNKGFIANQFKKLKLIVFQKLISNNNKKPINMNKLAKKYKIPIWNENDVNSKEFIQKIRTINTDLIVSAAYPQIFSYELISTPSKGAVNFHPSLLPKFRGAHPHYWAIVKGEIESGITAHFMTEKIDDGDIIAQIKFPIMDYNYEHLYNKIIIETPNIVAEVNDFFIKGKGNVIKQNHSDATYFRNDRKIHHRIFFEKYSDEEILNLVRGGNAYCFFRNKEIVIVECFLSDTNRNLTNNIIPENGSIIDLTPHYFSVQLSRSVMNITKVKYKSKKPGASKFFLKHKPVIGEKLE